MIERPRRLRTTAAMRRLVRETRPRPAQLVLPVFVGETPAEIGAMPGVRRHTVEQIGDITRSAAEAGLGGIMLFGVPDDARNVVFIRLSPNGLALRLNASDRAKYRNRTV